MKTLIVGGQRSGKSGQAERLALDWLAGDARRSVSVFATALPGDDDMRLRILHHQARRPAAFETLETPRHLAQALQDADRPEQLLLVECLTLWLTNWLMPLEGPIDTPAWQRERDAVLQLLPQLKARLVLVSNEVGWGVSPMSREARHFVDELGRLNQDVAARCDTLTLMVAGQAWSRPVQGHPG